MALAASFLVFAATFAFQVLKVRLIADIAGGMLTAYLSIYFLAQFLSPILGMGQDVALSRITVLRPRHKKFIALPLYQTFALFAVALAAGLYTPLIAPLIAGHAIFSNVQLLQKYAGRWQVLWLLRAVKIGIEVALLYFLTPASLEMLLTYEIAALVAVIALALAGFRKEGFAFVLPKPRKLPVYFAYLRNSILMILRWSGVRALLPLVLVASSVTGFNNTMLLVSLYEPVFQALSTVFSRRIIETSPAKLYACLLAFVLVTAPLQYGLVVLMAKYMIGLEIGMGVAILVCAFGSLTLFSMDFPLIIRHGLIRQYSIALLAVVALQILGFMATFALFGLIYESAIAVFFATALLERILVFILLTTRTPR